MFNHCLDIKLISYFGLNFTFLTGYHYISSKIMNLLVFNEYGFSDDQLFIFELIYFGVTFIAFIGLLYLFFSKQTLFKGNKMCRNWFTAQNLSYNAVIYGLLLFSFCSVPFLAFL